MDLTIVWWLIVVLRSVLATSSVISGFYNSLFMFDVWRTIVVIRSVLPHY